MREHSLSKGHPIETLGAVKAEYAAKGIKIRVRYRGPRAVAIGRLMPSGYRRSKYNAYQDCLKADATHFSVYPR